jgi:indole-3-glycerol phosphate synthase
MNELERIVAATREELGRRRSDGPGPAAAGHEPRRELFAQALGRDGVSVIAEHKRRSPSAGVIRDGASLHDVVIAYERGGAAALSILTEGPSFGGSLEDLQAAREATELPILRKDFIIDPFQLEESAGAGADAVLLIVAALEGSQLRLLHERAGALGLATLVEVHDRRELEVALDLGAEVIGINNRDLTTLAVDTRTTFELRPLAPPGTLVVAESGFSERSQLLELAQADVDAVLIGEALMRAEDPQAACRTLTSPI